MHSFYRKVSLIAITIGALTIFGCEQVKEKMPEAEEALDQVKEKVSNLNAEQEPKPLLTQVKLPNEPTYDQIKPYLKTGDVLLFYDFDTAGIEIMLVDMAIAHVPPLTHVGIVFELPENNGLPAGLYFWQAIPPKDVLPQTYGNDWIKGAESTGAQMVSLDKVMEYLSTIKGIETQYVLVRQLSKALSDSEKDAMLKYAREVDGRSFSWPIPEDMAFDYFLGAKEGKQSTDYSFFCSKLASQTFQNAGLIDSVITNSVLPGHFAISPGDKENLITFKTNALDSIVQFLPN